MVKPFFKVNVTTAESLDTVPQTAAVATNAPVTCRTNVVLHVKPPTVPTTAPRRNVSTAARVATSLVTAAHLLKSAPSAVVLDTFPTSARAQNVLAANVQLQVATIAPDDR